MSYRNHLPQLDGGLFLTDGGIETTLIFHEGLDLPLFAAFDLLKDDDGTAALRRYYEPYAALAREHDVGFVLESPTWRASPRWAGELGYNEAELDKLNRKAIALMEEIRDELDSDAAPIVISGCVGPHDDGYSPATKLAAADARDYHATQIATFAETAADMITAITMTYAEEAIGVALAAQQHGLPAAISFTVETDGRLPSGQALGEAIRQTDDETNAVPAYYMINCAHPTHFEAVFAGSRGLARSDPRPARKRLHQEPRRARRGHRARRGRSGRSGPPLRRAQGQASAAHGAGRVLRHRSPARGRGLQGLAGRLVRGDFRVSRACRAV